MQACYNMRPADVALVTAHTDVGIFPDHRLWIRTESFISSGLICIIGPVLITVV